VFLDQSMVLEKIGFLFGTPDFLEIKSKWNSTKNGHTRI
jgi:hypothetical protein